MFSNVGIDKMGVSLAFLEQFVVENGIAGGMTATEVVDRFVKPQTKDIGREGSGPFVELIQDGFDEKGRHWCSVPTHMFSYSWKYSVSAIVGTLRAFEDEDPRAAQNYYYIDQFAIDQHDFAKGCSSQAEAQDKMIETLKLSINRPGKVICMLFPGNNPVPLTRIWCLFELYTAILLGATVFMRFPPDEADDIYQRLMALKGKGKSLVPQIEVRNANASMEKDRQRILTEIQSTIGLDAFNAELQVFMEKALREVVEVRFLQHIGR
jgi:hypothetical protein